MWVGRFLFRRLPVHLRHRVLNVIHHLHSFLIGIICTNYRVLHHQCYKSVFLGWMCWKQLHLLPLCLIFPRIHNVLTVQDVQTCCCVVIGVGMNWSTFKNSLKLMGQFAWPCSSAQSLFSWSSSLTAASLMLKPHLEKQFCITVDVVDSYATAILCMACMTLNFLMSVVGICLSLSCNKKCIGHFW